MGRRNMWLTAVLAAVLVLRAGAALANGQTDPYRGQMEAFKRQEMQYKRQRETQQESAETRGLRYGWGGVAIACSGTPAPGSLLTFTASATGYNSSGLSFAWGISDENRDPNGYLYYPQHDDLLGKSSISYRFYSAGRYSVYVVVYDGSGSWVGSDYLEFTIADDAAHDTLEEKAAKIVSECRGSTQWETALNLYDWLTHHAYYDNTREHHGADILFLGYGVCDSYSKAYLLLLQTAGITAERAISSTHAWNTLKLGGKWYQADATWDDPGSYAPGSGSLVSGSEGHVFFCLTSEIMQQIRAHELQSGEHATQCVSLEANYFIHENKWQDWGDRVYQYGSGYIVKPYIQQISEAFNQGEYAWESNFSFVYYMENSTQKYLWAQGDHLGILQSILAWALNRESVVSLDGDGVLVNAEVTASRTGLQVRMTGWDIEETGTLKLPAGAQEAAPEAFAGTAATTVNLSNCKRIQSGAFRNSAVRRVYIPSAVTYIAEDAFENCGRLIFVTEDATAVAYARQHGIIAIPPEE